MCSVQSNLGPCNNTTVSVRLLSKHVSEHAHLQLLQLGDHLEVGEQHVVADDEVREVLQRLELGVEPAQEEDQQLATRLGVEGLQSQGVNVSLVLATVILIPANVKNMKAYQMQENVISDKFTFYLFKEKN